MEGDSLDTVMVLGRFQSTDSERKIARASERSVKLDQALTYLDRAIKKRH
jgi:hypothetical protein